MFETFNYRSRKRIIVKKKKKERGEKEFKAKPIKGKINNSIFSLSTIPYILSNFKLAILALWFPHWNFTLIHSCYQIQSFHSGCFYRTSGMHVRPFVYYERIDTRYFFLFILRWEFTTKICPLQISTYPFCIILSFSRFSFISFSSIEFYPHIYFWEKGLLLIYLHSIYKLYHKQEFLHFLY